MGNCFGGFGFGLDFLGTGLRRVNNEAELCSKTSSTMKDDSEESCNAVGDGCDHHDSW